MGHPLCGLLVLAWWRAGRGACTSGTLHLHTHPGRRCGTRPARQGRSGLRQSSLHPARARAVKHSEGSESGLPPICLQPFAERSPKPSQAWDIHSFRSCCRGWDSHFLRGTFPWDTHSFPSCGQKNRPVQLKLRGWFRVQAPGPSAAMDGRSRAYRDVFTARPGAGTLNQPYP